MNIKMSERDLGVIGICGHAGIGHTHSHSGFIQDDTVGFSVVASLLKKALSIDSCIASVDVDLVTSKITVKTKDGGIGESSARRGITPFEVKLFQNIIGFDAVFSQHATLKALGRTYGQGTMEVAVALQAAIIQAFLNTFEVKYPEQVEVVTEDIQSNQGKILGTVININAIPVSILLTINASSGGIGPVEDLEGNVSIGAKGKLMKKIGMKKIPTIIVESKNFNPSKAQNLENNHFLIRAHQDFDNISVAESMMRAAEELGINYQASFDELARHSDDFENKQNVLSDKIIDFGNKLKRSMTSADKVDIISQLAILISQEAGGVTFMSNDLQKIVGSAGMVPGTSAVLSLLVTREYIEHYQIPYMTETDLKDYLAIIQLAVTYLYKQIDEAKIELEEKYNFDENQFDYLLRK